MKQAILIVFTLLLGMFLGSFFSVAAIDIQKSHIELLQSRIAFLQTKVSVLQDRLMQDSNALVN